MPPQHDLAALRARIGDRTIIASVSGGKDSTAMALYLKELGLPFQAMFIDIGWENRTTLDYVRDQLPGILGQPVHWLVPKIDLPPELDALARRFEEKIGHPSGMVRLCLKKAMFPSKQRRWCTKDLKVKPVRDYLRSLDCEPINTVGIRHQESKARSKMPEWEANAIYDCDVWRPIVRWTQQDVIDIHTRHGAMPNPGYLAGAERVGCWPCIYSRKSEIRHIAVTDPDRISLMEELEATLYKLLKAKYTAAGDADKLARLEESKPGWFAAPYAPKRKDGTRSGAAWPIRKVVEWSWTKAHNGRQFELFIAPPRERGCMRWGLCDTGNNDQKEGGQD